MLAKDEGETEDAKEPAENIKDAVSKGDADIQIETSGDKVIVNFNPMETDEKEMQEAVKAIQSVKAALENQKQKFCLEALKNNLLKLTTASNQKGKK